MFKTRKVNCYFKVLLLPIFVIFSLLLTSCYYIIQIPEQYYYLLSERFKEYHGVSSDFITHIGNNIKYAFKDDERLDYFGFANDYKEEATINIKEKRSNFNSLSFSNEIFSFGGMDKKTYISYLYERNDKYIINGKIFTYDLYMQEIPNLFLTPKAVKFFLDSKADELWWFSTKGPFSDEMKTPNYFNFIFTYEPNLEKWELENQHLTLPSLLEPDVPVFYRSEPIDKDVIASNHVEFLIYQSSGKLICYTRPDIYTPYSTFDFVEIDEGESFIEL
ncbi:MAG: hypothetical protein LBM99_03170 [Bacillales bacterium]|jgi:hypothetical protein|nr:hypothetical protein [Bacillales bacterium]